MSNSNDEVESLLADRVSQSSFELWPSSPATAAASNGQDVRLTATITSAGLFIIIKNSFFQNIKILSNY